MSSISEVVFDKQHTFPKLCKLFYAGYRSYLAVISLLPRPEAEGSLGICSGTCSRTGAGPRLLERRGRTRGFPVLLCEAGGVRSVWEPDCIELPGGLRRSSFIPGQFLLQSPSPLARRCSRCQASRRAAGGCLLGWSVNFRRLILPFRLIRSCPYFRDQLS